MLDATKRQVTRLVHFKKYMKRKINPYFILHGILFLPIKLAWKYKLRKQVGHETMMWFDEKSLIHRYQDLISNIAEVGIKWRNKHEN